MEQKLKCCVIDDEPLARDLICGFINKTPFLELEGSYASASEAIRPIIEGRADLVFLDIQMPELNGMEFAKVIPPDCRIVFVTAYEQYAIDGFRQNALDYLLKPVSYSEFLTAANRALQWKVLKEQASSSNNTPDDNHYIIVKSEYKLVQIDTSRITYIEGLKDYVKIYTEDSPNCIMSLMKMKSLEQYLPSGKFIRVHRSFIVNMENVKLIERNRIVFGKTYIPISDTYKDAFTTYLQSHTVTDSPNENQSGRSDL